MRKPLFDLSYWNNNNVFSIEDYNAKKNAKLKSDIKNLNLDQVDELYYLLEQYKQSKINKNLLNIINTKIEVEKYNIKGICHMHSSDYSKINSYLEHLIEHKKYYFEFHIYKIFNKQNNKLISREQSKYKIILLNINKETKNFLEKNLINFPRAVLLFTNLQAEINLDEKNQLQFNFKSTDKTKVYMEKNKLMDSTAKTNFLPSGIYIDLLKSNEFDFINYISTQNLFELQKSKFSNNYIQGIKYEICLDLKMYLEINTETLYVENTKEEFSHCHTYLQNNISLCCYVKNYHKNNTNKTVNFILENIFDLNCIILEIPQNDENIETIYTDCIYVFFDLILFIDEKMNIKLKLQKNKTRIILLYFLIDFEKYEKKKLNDLLIVSPFSQLMSLISSNKIVRTINKYLVSIIKLNYMNIFFSKNNEISYDVCLHCSDGTSSAFAHIKGKDFSELKKLGININSYSYQNNNNENNLKTIFPDINNDSQLVILGTPFLSGLKELSFLDIYENINELKKYEKINSNSKKQSALFNFDILMTKNEFTTFNGTFLKNSQFIESIPVIKILKFWVFDEYINLLEINKINNDI
jgi:hypothetical protein